MTTCPFFIFQFFRVWYSSLIAQQVKNLPAPQETPVPSLGLEDPLKEEMATRSSILTWRIPWTEKPGGLQSMGCKSQIQLKDYTVRFLI